MDLICRYDFDNKKDMIAKNIEAFMFGYNIIKEGKYE